jgi:hypothetical protein
MVELKLMEGVVFGILSVLGVFVMYYSTIILLALIKHRKDKAPLTSYFLNPETIKIPYFVFAGIFGFLAGVMVLSDYLDNGFNPSTLLQYSTFFSGFGFAVLTIIFIILDIRFWYLRFKRFA